MPKISEAELKRRSDEYAKHLADRRAKRDKKDAAFDKRQNELGKKKHERRMQRGDYRSLDGTPDLPGVDEWIAMVHTPIVKNDDGSFDCQLNVPGVGTIPFTATADDPEEHGRAIHAHLSALPGSGE